MNPLLFTQKSGYSLIELIVTITILSILCTTGYIFASEQTASARDAKRVSDITTMRDASNIHLAHLEHMPLSSDTALTFTASGNAIGYQANSDAGLANKLNIPLSSLLDPSTNTAYTYRLHANKEFYQYLALLENPKNGEQKSIRDFFRSNTQDSSKTKVYPYTLGDNIGVFLTEKGDPLHLALSASGSNMTQEISSVLANPSYLVASNGHTVLTTNTTTTANITSASVGE